MAFVVMVAVAMYAGICLLVSHSLHVQTLLAYSHFMKVFASIYFSPHLATCPTPHLNPILPRYEPVSSGEPDGPGQPQPR